MTDATESLLPRDSALAEFGDITLISAGRNATVYRARELATGRAVALKVFENRYPTATAREAFERQSDILSRLGSHPNIVTLYRRVDLSDGRIALVLELCVGSLRDRPGPPAGDRAAHAVEIGIKIAGALETAHRAGIVHRDVRPQNVLLTSFGEPALSDFGTATLLYAGDDALMQFATSQTAPELIEGSPGIEATDVYGLAATIYEFITGAPVFPAYEGESQAALLLRVIRDPAPPIVAPDVPLELSDVLQWALAKDPAKRPPSAGWLADELARISAHNDWPRTRLLIRGGPAMSRS